MSVPSRRATIPPFLCKLEAEFFLALFADLKKSARSPRAARSSSGFYPPLPIRVFLFISAPVSLGFPSDLTCSSGTPSFSILFLPPSLLEFFPSPPLARLSHRLFRNSNPLTCPHRRSPPILFSLLLFRKASSCRVSSQACPRAPETRSISSPDFSLLHVIG